MKKILYYILAGTAALVLVGSCRNNVSSSAKEGETVATADAVAPETTIDSTAIVEKELSMAEKIAKLPEEPMFDIVTSLGTIRIKLYKNTPKHRENFEKLALGGFYNGILFHRVIKGFMIQAGDPLTKDEANADMFGTGGPGYTVPAEFVKEYTHKKGALAAARRGDAANPFKESSGSQFYIVHDPVACAPLDGDYTVFGETVQGFEVIDQIASVQTGRRDRPVQDVKIITIKTAE